MTDVRRAVLHDMRRRLDRLETQEAEERIEDLERQIRRNCEPILSRNPDGTTNVEGYMTPDGRWLDVRG